MQRLDNEFLMRTSDCPLLQRRPSEYMREMWFSTQPMERTAPIEMLEQTFKLINAEQSLLYASDYPHWDFDVPSVIYDLPFLTEQGKRNILVPTRPASSAYPRTRGRGLETGPGRTARPPSRSSHRFSGKLEPPRTVRVAHRPVFPVLTQLAACSISL